MKIIEVKPIAKGIFKERLYYFTSQEIELGSLVTVPIRRKNVPAIVFSSEDVQDAKTFIKTTGFSLKPLKTVQAKKFLLDNFLEVIKNIADYFLSPLGLALKDFLPQAVLNANISIIDNGGFYQNLHFEKSILGAPLKERLQYYKTIIRTEFAKNKSVFLCLPTISGIKEISEELKKGIEDYTIIIHGKLSSKKIKESWEKALKVNHPIIIIATPTFLALPKKDIKTLIIDNESSSGYKLQKQPYLDIRKSAEIIAQKLGYHLIFGDYILRAETFYKKEIRDASSLHIENRILSDASQIIADSQKSFSPLTSQLKNILVKAQENKERTLLFINRRGHSPTTICQDCLLTLLCPKCDTPLVMHKENGKKAKFICHKCLSEISAMERCPNCKSWRLETLGIGVQKIIDEARKLIPKATIIRMDSDTIKTEKQGEAGIKKFFSTAGAILAGTEIVFSYLNRPEEKIIDNIGIVSIDSMFSLPDFKINEKIFNLLMKLRFLAKKNFLIQTRLKEQKIFDLALRGDIYNFYQNELENRKLLGYPPFKLLIKITKDGRDKFKLKKEMDQFAKKLEKWTPISYPAFISKIKNIYAWHILLKLEPSSWPNGQIELRNILSSLTPDWKINIDPESLL